MGHPRILVDIVTIDRKGTGVEIVDWVHLAQDEVHWLREGSKLVFEFHKMLGLLAMGLKVFRTTCWGEYLDIIREVKKQ
jgi:hypothetical protein